jgi:hypothetical protein
MSFGLFLTSTLLLLFGDKDSDIVLSIDLPVYGDYSMTSGKLASVTVGGVFMLIHDTWLDAITTCSCFQGCGHCCRRGSNLIGCIMAFHTMIYSVAVCLLAIFLRGIVHAVEATDDSRTDSLSSFLLTWFLGQVSGWIMPGIVGICCFQRNRRKELERHGDLWPDQEKQGESVMAQMEGSMHACGVRVADTVGLPPELRNEREIRMRAQVPRDKRAGDTFMVMHQGRPVAVQVPAGAVGGQVLEFDAI